VFVGTTNSPARCQPVVRIGGRWGELQLGRMYTPTFLVHATYDAFGPQGVAAQQVLLGSMELAQPADIRANNAVNYRSPTFLGGFALQAMTSASEGVPGKHSGVRAGFAAGGFAGDAAAGSYDDPPSAT
jgi:predicted porin